MFTPTKTGICGCGGEEIKRGHDYPASWRYAEKGYSKEELKEMAEKYLPSFYPIKKPEEL